MDDLNQHEKFLNHAIELARLGSEAGHGGPFGAIVVKDGHIIGEGYNRVTDFNDPSAHAEIVAIRQACNSLNDFQLSGCIIYTSCEPCPMCLGAIYWARPEKVFFASTKMDAAKAGFDDAFIYEEIKLSPDERNIPMHYLKLNKANDVFEAWKANPGKINY